VEMVPQTFPGNASHQPPDRACTCGLRARPDWRKALSVPGGTVCYRRSTGSSCLGQLHGAHPDGEPYSSIPGASYCSINASCVPCVYACSTSPSNLGQPPICGSNRAGYAPTSVSGSSSAQANGYQAPLTLDNMPSNTLSFEQSFQFRTDEVGMPLPLQNGNPTSYQDYTDLWNARTQ
jgi:hypothetical protein